MDPTTIGAIAAVLLVVVIGLVLAAPLYSSSRRTQKIEDPTTRALAERAEEDLWRLRQRSSDMP
jgi:hypothetical protein